MSKYRGLVVSPVRPQKTGQGNRARVFDLSASLSQFADLDLLYYLYETPGSVESAFETDEELKKIFTFTFPVAPTIPTQLPPSDGKYHKLDEWWDPALDGTLKYLSSNFDYDFIIVNYLWLTKAFTFFPESVVKIIDTHDKFSERQRIYDQVGLPREFFYCTQETEREGLRRAQICIALQDQDRDYFLSLVPNSDQITLPHIPVAQTPDNLSVAQKSTGGRLRIGLLGVNNKVNAFAFNKFLMLLNRQGVASADLEVFVAGSVGEAIRNDDVYIKSLGYVPNLSDFFSQIDLFVNPVEYSTGQKIKLADAISAKAPFLSTLNGTEGLPTSDPCHQFDTLDNLVQSVSAIVQDSSAIERLKDATEELYSRMIRIRESSLESIERLIGFYRRNIVIYADATQGFYANELLLERASKLLAAVRRVGKLSFVVDRKLVEVAQQYAPAVSLEDYLGAAPSVIDCVISFGSCPEVLRSRSRRVLLDELSSISKAGQLAHKEADYLLRPGKAYSDQLVCLSVPYDAGYKYPEVNDSGNHRYALILASNYDDAVPRLIKKILSEHVHSVLVYPHQIMNYRSISDYVALVERTRVVIILDDTDPRYSMLRAVCGRYSVPQLNLRRLFGFSSGVTVLGFVRSLRALTARVIRANPGLRYKEAQSIWSSCRELWGVLRG